MLVAATATTVIARDDFRVVPAESGALVITTRAGLEAIASDLAGSYALGADIDLGGADWTPIGNDLMPFTGTLYGNGHAIRNLVCTNNPSGNNYRGLFGYAQGATFEGVSVSGTVAGKQYVGGLVGRAWGGTVISNCSAAVEVTATGSYAGGLVGSCDGGSVINRIIDCRADGYVGGNGYVGGFIGYVYAPVLITNCVARGDVRSSGSDYGGFVGRFADASATIDGCWCSGAVWGTGGSIGSFIGNWQSGTITNCAASAYANGLRLFCGNDTAIKGDMLSLSEVHARSAGWPSAPKRSNSASMTPIASVEDFLAITNSLAGRYVLVADIDFDGATIEPIGGSSAAFTGEFYGQGHRILGFEVASDDRYAGLFGKIAGGRVSGVAVEGAVTGFCGNESATDVGVGGFAGKIDSKSLVEGCSFDGEVANETTCNAGGFVGYTTDSPVILRCRAWGSVDNSSGKSGAGGFVGSHSGGSIADCCALMECTATDNGDASAGGFAGLVAAARIATCCCSGSVDSRGGYVGAFVGKASTGLITSSYYDTSANGSMEAVGKSSGGSAAYAGITPIDPAEKYNAASYPSFDFTNTWSIAEGVDEPRLVPLTGFTTFLDEYCLSLNTDPCFVTNGIPLIVRYAYGMEPLTATVNAEGRPLVDFGMGADGPVFTLAPQKNSVDCGLKFSVLWSRTLSPWQTVDEISFDEDGDGNDSTCNPPIDIAEEPHMFFKYRVEVLF